MNEVGMVGRSSRRWQSARVAKALKDSEQKLEARGVREVKKPGRLLEDEKVGPRRCRLRFQMHKFWEDWHLA